jgi:hypothetical protein
MEDVKSETDLYWILAHAEGANTLAAEDPARPERGVMRS